MNVLRVEHLSKNYEKFSLEDVNLSLDQGYIIEFIGRKGASKTTTLK